MTSPRSAGSMSSIRKAANMALSPSEAPPTLFTLTGENPNADAMAHVANELAAPFMQAPPAHQGALGYVTQGLGGVLGLLNAPAVLLDTGFALATAGIPSVPMPAAVIGLALHIGWPHGHAHPPSLIPPAPPIPLPSIGTVLLAGAWDVLINGVPAARAGDVGIAITCCSIAPPLEIILGSSSVFIAGSRAARLGDMTRHDNPFGKMAMFDMLVTAAGMVAGVLGSATQLMDATNSMSEAAAADSAAEAEAAAAAAAGQALGAAVMAAQVAADAAALALQIMIGKDPGIGPGFGFIMIGSPNVLIGGFPCPNLLESLKGLLRAAKKLRGEPARNQDAEGEAGHGATSCGVRG